MSSQLVSAWEWLPNGNVAFPVMLASIESARSFVRLETYIFAMGEPGERFRAALTRAAARGVQVKVLVDAIGSFELPESFWTPLREAGGEVRVFNPLALNRFGIRNHRKLLVCDDTVAFVGGFNIAAEYEGNGVTRGWRDLGLRLEGAMAVALAESFDQMFGLADFQHRRFARFRKTALERAVQSRDEQLLLGGPGRGQNPIRHALRRDFAQARDVEIMEAYFLPPLRLRRALMRVAKRGGWVRLILAGKSDVTLSQLAGRSLYARLLKAGAEIYEYEPQVLHAKLIVIDNIVYVGSANLDPRSLSINYELMLRLQNPQMALEARKIIGETLTHCRRVTLEECRKRTFWQRIKQWWAHLLLARIDPHVARQQWRALPRRK